MKQFLDFIEKHKNFIKRVIIFFIAYICLTITKSPMVEQLLIQIFGEYLVTGIEAAVPTILLTTEM